jgi:CheY-like chemotaxis protein
MDGIQAAGAAGPLGTVLVVDDDVRILGLTGEMLRLAGYEVIEARLAAEALGILERKGRGIDVVLTDMQMPGMTGGELAGRLRTRAPHLPVVFMSGSGEDSVPPGTLHKPFRMADLFRMISSALKRAGAQ